MKSNPTGTRKQLKNGLWALGLSLPLVVFPAWLALADDAYDQGNQTAKEMQGKINDATSASPDSYPGYNANPDKEKGYYKSGLGIEDEARKELPNHQIGTDMTNAAYSRPRYLFDQREPELMREKAAMQSGSSLTASYSGCESLAHTSGEPSYSPASCFADGLNPFPTCERQRNAVCPANNECELAMDVSSINSDMAWNYSYPTLTLGTIANDYWGGNCSVYDRTTTFNIDDVATIKEFKLFEVGFDDWQLIEVNGSLVSNGPYGGDRQQVIGGGRVQYSATKSASCELKTSWHQSRDVDIRPFLKSGANTIRQVVVVSGKGEGYMRFTVRRYCDCPDTGNDTFTTQACERNVDPPGCHLRSTSCLEGPEHRIVNGQPVFRECWRYQDSYQCEDGVREEAACQSLRDNRCEQTNANCVEYDSSNGRCKRFRHDFRCPSGSGDEGAATLCGSDLYCPGGSCSASDRVPEPTPPEEMARAVSWLSAAQNTANDFATDPFRMFTGNGMKCAKTDFGFSNCCSDSGWGISIGLDSCNDEEKQLGIARETGRAHYVGSFQSGSFPDERTYQVYCVFSSKLSRILQEQGRPQLGIGWGDAKNPDCRALTAEEVGQLDWNLMDLSEFYADAEAKAAETAKQIESSNTLQERMQEKVQKMQSKGSSSGG